MELFNVTLETPIFLFIFFIIKYKELRLSREMNMYT